MPSPLHRIAIVGAGGFARELAWLIRDINAQTPTFEIVGYLVSDPKYLTLPTTCVPVLGDFEWLDRHRSDLDGLVLAIGTPAARKRLVGELEARCAGVSWPSLVHPSFRADFPTLKLGRGVVICAGVTATVNVDIGEFAFVNLHCTLGHEVQLGAYSGINPGANISGGVQTGEGVLIGTGAQVLEGRVIGDGATVGAGSVVTRDVAPRATVVGVPAKPMAVMPTVAPEK